MRHGYRQQRVKLYRFFLVGLLLAMIGNLLLPSHALAWKPTTHVFLGEIALKDALDDGKVTINRVNYRTGDILGVIGEYDVDPTILAALQNYAPQYHAGILGPDAYPDILTGQQAIHPSFEHTETPLGSEAWLSDLWDQSTFVGNDTLPIRAFTVGYLTHAAGDMFGHTFINNFAGGEFAITPPEGPANAIKHIILEGYIDKRMDTSLLDASVFDVSIGDGVDNFIYKSLVDARAGTYLGAQLLREGAPGTEFSIPRIFSSIRDNVEQDIINKRKAAAACAWFNPTCSAVILNLTASYLEAWRDDIDEGLRLWPEVSHKVAVALFYNSERKADIETANAILEEYATLHLLSMAGQPDFVGLTIDFIGDVIDAITPDFFLEPIRQLKEEILNTLLREAIGMDKDDLKEYLTNPELYFDTVMNSGAGELVTLQQMNGYLHLSDTGYTNPGEHLSYLEVPAVYNTATMSKLIFLSKSEVNRLLSDLGSSARLYQPNVMLGFIPSLDGSRQWLNGMVFAQDNNAYCQVFMLQPGETPINCLPVAQADVYSLTNNAPLVVAASGVLANDSDPDGDTLTPTVNPAFLPQHGSVVMQADGGFTYTHSGTATDDVFGYTLSDGSDDSNTVLVTLVATPGNAAPVTRIDGVYQLPQDTSIAVLAPGVLVNDHDPDGDPMSAIVTQEPSNGSLTLNSSGSFVYTPDPFFAGIDTFQYKVNDGAVDSASTEVGIEVIANPNVIEAKQDTYVTLKNRTLNIPAPGLLANDTDRDDQPLTAEEPPISSIIGGLPTLHADGSFTFVPAGNFFGEGEFSYLATDTRVDSNVSATKIIIRQSNAAPVAVDNGYATTSTMTITVGAPGILGNDWDSDYHAEYIDFGLPATDPMTASLVSAPSKGILTLHDDGSFTYVPGNAFTGRDSFTYKVSDGWDESNVATVRISDNSLNQAPVASDDAYQTPKNTQLLQAAPGFLTNDTDADGDPISVLPGSDPLTGTVKINPDGSFVYSPTIGFEGFDSFTYTIADTLGVTRTATVNITVGEPVAQNQQPTALDDVVTTQQGFAITITVMANDSDLDGDPLSVTLVTQPGHGSAAVSGGQIVYSPQAGFIGSDTFIYRIQDGKGGLDTATVIVHVIEGEVIPPLIHLPLMRKAE